LTKGIVQPVVKVRRAQLGVHLVLQRTDLDAIATEFVIYPAKSRCDSQRGGNGAARIPKRIGLSIDLAIGLAHGNLLELMRMFLVRFIATAVPYSTAQFRGRRYISAAPRAAVLLLPWCSSGTPL
jgi:hypothetical protein